MKKTISILLCLMLSLPLVFASSFVKVENVMNVVEKDANWDVVEDGAHGVIKYSTITKMGKVIQERVRVSVWGLEPKTKYQLIYYGNEEFNDVWPYATCIGKARMTSTQGYFKGTSAVYNHQELFGDAIPQKFWVILASDIDCEEGVMTAWNPSEYLFEWDTI